MNKNIVQYENLKQQVVTFRELATVAIRSGCYGNMTIETAMNVMLTAADMGVSPMKALNGGFHVIKGKIMIAGHLISDRIRRDGHSLRIVEHTLEKCVILGVRKDNEDSYKCEYTLEEAQLAGLLGSPTWQKYRKDMLYNRCMGRIGRVLFSDIVGACYTEDEGQDILGTPAHKRPDVDPEEIWVNQEVSKRPAMEILVEKLTSEGINEENLVRYINHLSEKNGQTTNQIAEFALMEKYTQRFIDSFKKEEATYELPQEEVPQEEVAQ